MKADAPDLRQPIRRGPVEFTIANEADQEAIYQTLLHVFQGPDRETFLGALSDPSYLPEHRLVARLDGRIASHVHLTTRTMRYGVASLPMNGVMWVGTLPEFRGLGLAQNLMRLAKNRALQTGAVVQALTTTMPQFYRPLGWGVCGNQTFGIAPSRNLPSSNDGLVEGKGGAWHVRPWRHVELNDLMDLYEKRFAHTTGAIIRSEDYWRWLIGRRYAHVIWVACQGETVRGYAFVKDHRVLELASHPAHPQAMHALIGRIRAEALERAYPEVTFQAPLDDPVQEEIRGVGGRLVDQEVWEGSSSMYYIPDPEPFLKAALPELVRRVKEARPTWPFELGLVVGEHRLLVKIDARSAKIIPDKLSRRYLTLTPAAFARLALGHTGIDRAVDEDGVESSASTAIDSARIIFPPTPIWRSPLDCATA